MRKHAQRAHPGPDGGPVAAAADRCTGESAYCGTEHRAAHPTLDSSLFRGHPPDLGTRIIPAVDIVGAKLIKALTPAGQ